MRSQCCNNMSWKLVSLQFRIFTVNQLWSQFCTRFWCYGMYCACFAGFTLISECATDWCSIGHLGSQAISAVDGDFHMCTNSTDEVQSLVSSTLWLQSVHLFVPKAWSRENDSLFLAQNKKEIFCHFQLKMKLKQNFLAQAITHDCRVISTVISKKSWCPTFIERNLKSCCDEIVVSNWYNTYSCFHLSLILWLHNIITICIT